MAGKDAVARVCPRCGKVFFLPSAWRGRIAWPGFRRTSRGFVYYCLECSGRERRDRR